MLQGIIQAALTLARMRWEYRMTGWTERMLDERQRRDIGLPPRPELPRRAPWLDLG